MQSPRFALIRIHLKNRIFKQGTNKDIGPKDIFEMNGILYNLTCNV
jgi:hypothetical protein